MLNIEDWSTIADDFTEGLVLGNGASIAFHQGFAYESLLEEARRKGLIKPDVKSIFDHLHTKDFERVLRMLWHTTSINRALKIRDKETKKAYKSVVTALVQAVTTIHPAYTEISKKLPLAAKFMKRFKIVVSLNYDLLVYWTMLCGNNRHRNQFKDCFIHGGFDSNWECYRKPYGNTAHSTLVFYPHGNLSLATDLDERETKLPASSSDLLDTITSEWESGKHTPLFVSEGTSKQKVSAINRSHYLKTIHDSVLPKLGKRVAIFGWSFSNNDTHILRAICRGNLTGVAVSVRTSSPKFKSECSEIQRKIEDASTRKRVNVVFYDASSQECWPKF